VKFDFLSPKDLFAIQILHTGKDSTSLSVKGTVIGAQKPLRARSDSEIIEEHLSKFPVKWMMRFPRLFLSSGFAGASIFFFYLAFLMRGNSIMVGILAIPAGFFAFIALSVIGRRVRTGNRAVEMYRETYGRMLSQAWAQRFREETPRNKK